MIVKSIVYEKELRLKETMRVMGLGNGVHWLGWFIDSLLPMMVTIVMLTSVLVVGLFKLSISQFFSHYSLAFWTQ